MQKQKRARRLAWRFVIMIHELHYPWNHGGAGPRHTQKVGTLEAPSMCTRLKEVRAFRELGAGADHLQLVELLSW